MTRVIWSQAAVLTLILSCWIPAFWTASCLWRKSLSSSCLAPSSLSVAGCLPLGGEPEGSCRPPLQPDLERGLGSTWGLPVWAVGLCALLGRGREVLFRGAKPLLGLRVQDLVALLKTSRYPLRRKSKAWEAKYERRFKHLKLRGTGHTQEGAEDFSTVCLTRVFIN